MFLKGALPMTHLLRLLSNCILCVSTLLTLVVDAVQCLNESRRTTAGAVCLAQPSDHVCVNRRYALVDLEGLLQGQTDTTEMDIDAILYQVPPDRDKDA